MFGGRQDVMTVTAVDSLLTRLATLMTRLPPFSFVIQALGMMH